MTWIQQRFRRPVTERDELGMAVGKAIDTAASQFSHEFGLRRKPTTASMVRLATSILDEELKDADLPLAPDRGTALRQIAEVLQAVRKSENLRAFATQVPACGHQRDRGRVFATRLLGRAPTGFTK